MSSPVLRCVDAGWSPADVLVSLEEVLEIARADYLALLHFDHPPEDIFSRISHERVVIKGIEDLIIDAKIRIARDSFQTLVM